MYISICLLFILIFLYLLNFLKNIGSLFNKPVCAHCNVILISLDTLGANHLPCYGYERNTAPNLCNFAKDNVFFTNFFSNASWTLPSHFSIFTSLYPNHHAMIESNKNNTNKLAPSISMMAEFFKKANYKTIYVGPTDDFALPFERGIGRGFDTILPISAKENLSSWDKGISQLLKNNSQKKSTFLFLHTYWVHDPYFINDVPGVKNKRIFTNDFYGDIALDKANYTKFSQEFKDYVVFQNEKNTDNSDYFPGGYFEKKDYKNIINNLKGAKNLSDAEKIFNSADDNFKSAYINSFYMNNIAKSNGSISYAKALYDELIYYLDKKLTAIFDLTSNKELADNTIIIITSDHGEEFMEHGTLTHPADSVYNTTTTVPLIMYIPGIKQKKVNGLAQSIDILPTVLKLTGIDSIKANFDGIDLTDSIFNRQNAVFNNYLISEGPSIDSIRNKRWKLYVKGNPSGGSLIYELYDLQNDPLEKNNLAQREPKIVKILQDNLNIIIYKR